jgi:UDP-glucose 4-epimerase
MKIAITGGAGFIGSNVADAYIELGHEVVIIDNLSTGRLENLNPKANFIRADITDNSISDIFKYEKFEILNHLAAQIDVRVSVNNPKFDALTNIVGGLNLYEAARASGVKKIIFSSTGGAIYGEQDYFPADEQHPTRPVSPYGIAKLANENYLFYYREVHGLDFAVLRYANVYGPRQNPHGEAGVVAIFINKMLSGSEPVINGDGKNSRDYVFVGDVVKANVLAINENFSGIYNVATGIESDVNFIFNTLKELTGSDCKEIHGETKAGEQRRSVCSYKKIHEKFEWKPEIDLKKGLKLTVDYFKNR